jgi:hypothetical protein
LPCKKEFAGIDHYRLSLQKAINQIFQIVTRSEDELAMIGIAAINVHEGKIARKKNDCKVQVASTEIAVVWPLVEV